MSFALIVEKSVNKTSHLLEHTTIWLNASARTEDTKKNMPMKK